MLIRHIKEWMDGELIREEFIDVTWHELRHARNAELVQTDPWAMSDRTMSQEQIYYRQFLRDLPGNFDSANEAADAWAAYEIPE